MQKVLIAACCAPCATVALEQYPDAVVHFWGNNLDTEQEYNKRKEQFKMEIIAEPYNPIEVKDCVECFTLRLKHSARFGLPFVTSLTTSPHKDAELINKIGSKFENYIPSNFKKNDGFAKSVQLSKGLGLYRQNYCGCHKSKGK